MEEDGVALVRVSLALPYHMGRYICINNVTQEHSSIFVYVKGGFFRGEEQDKEEAMWTCIVERSEFCAILKVLHISFKL